MGTQENDGPLRVFFSPSGGGRPPSGGLGAFCMNPGGCQVHGTHSSARARGCPASAGGSQLLGRHWSMGAERHRRSGARHRSRSWALQRKAWMSHPRRTPAARMSRVPCPHDRPPLRGAPPWNKRWRVRRAGAAQGKPWQPARGRSADRQQQQPRSHAPPVMPC